MIMRKVNSLVFIIIISSVTVSAATNTCCSCRTGNQLLKKSRCVAEYPEGGPRVDWQCFHPFTLHYLFTLVSFDSVTND